MQTSSSFRCNPQLLLLQLLPYLYITTLNSRSVLLSCLLLSSLSFDVHASAGQRSYNYLSFTAFDPSSPSSYSPTSISISNNPSTGWPLSDYDATSGPKAAYSFRDFAICFNFSSQLNLFNEDEGLYGKHIPIVSAHGKSYPVSFALYFVLAANNRTCDANAGACYYLSLVALKSNPINGQIIWTANSNRPVTENACLQLGDDSNLKLVEYYEDSRSSEVVWQTNTTGLAIGASLAITFEGNLVVFKNDRESNTTSNATRYVPIWESFQHPTDTLMVLQILQKPANLSLTGNSLSSQASSATSGAYTMAVEDRGLVLYARIGQVPQDQKSFYGAAYWVWPNISASKASSEIGAAALCWDSVDGLRLVAYAAGSISPNLDILSEIPPDNCSSNGTEFLGILNISDPNQLQPTKVTYATFLRLEADGDLHAYTTESTSTPWSSFYSLFDQSPCDLPLYCGFYGVCDRQKKDNRCVCEDNFKYVDESKPELGCDLNLPGAELPTDVSSLCSAATNGGDQMIPTSLMTVHNVHYFSLNFTEPQYNRTYEQCQMKCQNVCNCTAAFWNETGLSCFVIQSRIGTLQKQGGMVAFIKYNVQTTMPGHQGPTNSSRRQMVVGSAVAATVFALAIAVLASIYFLYKRRSAPNKLTELENERLLLSLSDSHRMPQRFSWKQLQEYTCGFSDFLGSGGFGSVFRGSLQDGTAIAVKQLDADGSHGQGDKEFIAEVSILSRTDHVHLVQLIGFCLEGNRRLLVYEYIENGSLDRWLFRGRSVDDPGTTYKSTRKQQALSWRRRLAIAVGTSKGMAYLHEDCKDKVIHMDLKPQNILLDRHFMPRISDFGISKRMSREQTTVMMMTVMRGTPGYLAPEWLLDIAVTEKCDVYSFGIVLLEMVSGRRVRDVSALKRKLAMGMGSLAETLMADVLDEDLKVDGSDVKVEEAVRMVEVALLCVRRDPTRRPAMNSVALMLEGKADVADSAMDDCDDDDVIDEDVHELLKLAMSRSSTKKTMRSTVTPRNNNATSSGESKSNSSWNEETGSCSSNMLSSTGTKSS